MMIFGYMRPSPSSFRGCSRPDARFLPALALLLGALGLFSAAPAQSSDAGVAFIGVNGPGHYDQLKLHLNTPRIYRVVLTSRPVADVTIKASGVLGIAMSPASHTFAASSANDWRKPKEFTVTSRRIGTASITHTVISADSKYASLADSDWDPSRVFLVSTLRPPTPTVSLSASPNPVTEGSSLMVMATLSSALASAVTIPLSLSHGTAEDGDYGSLSSITINSGSTTGAGRVSTNQDDDEDDETFTVALGTLPSSVTADTPSSVEVTIRDDDGGGTSPPTSDPPDTDPQPDPPDTDPQPDPPDTDPQPDPPDTDPQPDPPDSPPEQDDPAGDDDRDIPMPSVYLDVDDAEADQSLTALDVFPNRVFSIQIFGTHFQEVDETLLRFEYDSTKVVYERFSRGSVSGSTTLLGRDFVVIGMTLSKEQAVGDGKRLLGTIGFRTTEAFSGTDIRLMQVRVLGEAYAETMPLDLNIALGKATSLPEDFDGNGIVGISDFLLFVGAFGSREGQERYDAKYDLNGDGIVDSLDYSLFVEAFGSRVGQAKDNEK